MSQIEKRGEFHKVSDGIAYGWAVVSTIDGAPYVDTQGDHIPHDTIPSVAAEFMSKSRVGKDMHKGEQIADVLFALPVTPGIAKVRMPADDPTEKTGLVIGWKPHDPAILAKITAGERIGFSIGGSVESFEEETTKIAKSADSSLAVKPRVFRLWKLEEISLVDFPAQEPALVGVVKRRVLATTKEIAVEGDPLVDWLDPRDLVALRRELTKHSDAALTSLRHRLTALEVKATKSTHSPTTPTVTPMTEAELKTRIEELETQLADAKAKIAELEAKLDTKPADEVGKRGLVAFVSKSTGETFYASDDPRLINMAKRQDAQAEEIAKRDLEIEKANIRKIAAERMPHLPGGPEVHDYIVASLRKGGGDEAIVKAALDALAGGSAAIEELGEPDGSDGGTTEVEFESTSDDPATQLEDMAKSYAAKHSVPFKKAYAIVHASPEGRALYAASLNQ